jgi:phage terminase small subunit
MAEEDLGKKFNKMDCFIDQIVMNPDKPKIQLAMRSGYATKSIDKTVGRLMKDKKFLQRIEDRKLEVQAKLNVSLDRVSEEYARIAFLDPRDYVEFNEKDGITSKKSELVDLKPVLEINETRSGKGSNGKNTIRLKFYDKMEALKALRDMFGYDKPSKHAHLIAGNGQGINSKGIESAIIGLLGGTPSAPTVEKLGRTSK